MRIRAREIDDRAHNQRWIDLPARESFRSFAGDVKIIPAANSARLRRADRQGGDDMERELAINRGGFHSVAGFDVAAQ
jgi:hypothetical protein